MHKSAALSALLALAACSSPTASAEPSASMVPTAAPTDAASAEPSSPAAVQSTAPGVGAWAQLDVAGGPAAREDHTWTVDGDAGVAYVFGGRGSDGAALNDLWAYDLAADAWSQVAATGPAPRFGHEAVWVDGVGLVIFAGQAGSTFFNDLWAFDAATTTWRELPAGGAVPIPRYGSCAALGPDGRLWISHGFTSEGSRFADTVAYDFDAGVWTDESPAAERPVARCLHGCWWTDDDRFVLYAGQTTGVTALGDQWELRQGERPGTATWTQVAASLPPDRNLYAKTSVEGASLVFGGQALDGSYLGDLWSFPHAATGAVAVDTGGGGPSGRAGAELIWDAPRSRILLFGGKNDGGVLGDLWALPVPGV